MYLSTLFLSEIENGAQYAIVRCNEEFLSRFATVHDCLASSFLTDASEEVRQGNNLYDEMLALWDVFREFKEEIGSDLPVIQAMNTVCAARRQAEG